MATTKRRSQIEALTYFGPDGINVSDPPPKLLEDLILRHDPAHWRQGSGDSSLSVTIKEGPKTYHRVPGTPSLMFFMAGEQGFCFTYFQPVQHAPVQWITFAGGESQPWVRHNICGDSIYYPRACFVPRPVAWEVVQHFVRTRERSPAVPWRTRPNVEIRYPGAGDPIPDDADVA